MNREIKFRGKSIEEKEWCFGYLMIEKDDNFYIHWSDEFGNKKNQQVYKDSVGQLTGLVDVDGKDVWEGDLVKFTYKHYHEGESPLVVFFSNLKYGGWSIQLGENKESPFGIAGESKCIKVVGNIFDNPEFLGCRIAYRGGGFANWGIYSTKAD